MFSYRHGFHAGNHADVLKHLTLIATLKHLMLKDTALTVIDTHAGAGLYRLDSEHAKTSAEASEGVLALLKGLDTPVPKFDTTTQAIPEPVTDLLKTYRELLANLNSGNKLAQDTKVYPGSPFIAQSLLRPQDKLRLYELHPTDWRTLDINVRELHAGRQVSVKREDSFEALKALLPPTPINGSKRALVLIDPSYEIKSDYAKVEHAIAESLQRFSTGCYAVWYPIIPRPEAHSLPRRLKTLSNNAGKPFVHATLNIGRGEGDDGRGLSASGMFVINPPHTLRATLQALLPLVLTHLGRGRGEAVEVL